MDEFDSIARLFRPLAIAPEALGLTDDAAVLPARPGFDLVVTADTLVEGVHFRAEDPPDRVAMKALRVNLSDLAAKAAEPYGYLLATAWSPAWDETRRTAFAAGLAQDQARYGLKLFGGDTVSTPGPMSIGVTMMGWVERGTMPRRSGARPGDVLLVSGTIGDGGLGLKVLWGEGGALSDAHRSALVARYQTPDPRPALRTVLLSHARAAADVSDGLLADVGHVAAASGCRAVIELNRVPVSDAAAAWLATGEVDRVALAAFGDDYEVVCACAPEAVPALVAMADQAGVVMTVIGRMAAGSGVEVRLDGAVITAVRMGWRHG